ncbi:hypothetical protein [Photobacterium carnosum]|uniref:hypothetical protein n=1 Tax=Photobacterium carnosum TaxID=2023717 RepID=UPI001C90DF78|nr:hypothetical protein [Photobacterium carnosum]MBY3789147.1 hypothetical protein [Photobacterium carnosum]MCD9534206.1 hypothetical protein [Photobacterium carnosum]MCD9538032.1 hypothetical protein [Photobacterium carnosum]MCF2162755.1 hypothetical protein [Photobacterium carnosum]
MKKLIDELVLSFKKSSYPETAFYFFNDDLELEIRIPFMLPPEMDIFFDFIDEYELLPEHIKKQIRMSLYLNCPAIQIINIRNTAFRNKGNFSYLINKLLEMDEVYFVVIESVYSEHLTKILSESEKWKRLNHELYPEDDGTQFYTGVLH